MHILLIDASHNELVVNRDVLEALGHKVTGILKWEEAITFFAKEDINVVVTELNIPGVEGLELVEALGKLKPQVPIIILTEGISMSKAIKAVKLKAIDVLIKPLNVERMEALLKDITMNRHTNEIYKQADNDLKQKIEALRHAVEETQLQFKEANSKMNVLEEIAKQLLRGK